MKKYVGNTLQIRGAEKYILDGGRGNGMHFVCVRNGLGLEAWISVDRAGDISRVSFKGDNTNFFSACGYVSPHYYDGNGEGFLKSFTAGFITTCGLSAAGEPCEDGGEKVGLHGNVSNIPASLDAIEETNEGLSVKLTVNDTNVFGRKLVLKRVYTFSYSKNEIEISDTVTNEGTNVSPYMILYHCNFGYPLLKENSIVKIPNHSVTGRNAHASEYIDKALVMEKPQDNYEECCFYYDTVEKGGFANVGLFSPDIQKGVVLSYDKTSLPCFTEWKMMSTGDYVLGLEPGNCTPCGRNVLRERGTLKFLNPDESKTTSLKFSFVEGESEFESKF